jgi:hypothetical protein
VVASEGEGSGGESKGEAGFVGQEEDGGRAIQDGAASTEDSLWNG